MKFLPAIIACLIFSASFAQPKTRSYADTQYVAYKQQLSDLYTARGMPKDEIDALLRQYAQMELVSNESFAGVLSRIYQPGEGIAVLAYFFNNDTLIRVLLEPGVVKNSDTIRITRNELEILNANIIRSLNIYERTESRAPIKRGGDVTNEGGPVPGFNQAVALATKVLIPELFSTDYKHLIIVPALNIGAFPFYLLRPYKDSSYLVDKCSYSIAPSLIDLVKKRTDRFKGANIISNEHAFSMGNALFISNPAYPKNTDYIFPNLPGAKAEVKIAKQFTEKETVLDSLEATKEKVVKEMNGKDIVYFATHGVANADDPMQKSFLALTGESAFLTAKEVMELRNRPDFIFPKLVVLSACQTGLGKSMGAGIAGIARSFLLGGSDHVIMSLWSVDDAATSFLMGRFMYFMKTETKFTPADALRLAVLDAKAKYENPIYWASFSSFGIDRGPGSVFQPSDITMKINRETAGPNRFSPKDSLMIANKLKSHNRLKLVKESKNADLLLVRGKKTDSLIVRETGFLFGTSDNHPLEQDLLLYGRYKYLKDLVVFDPDMKVEVKTGRMKNGVISFKTSGGPLPEYRIYDTLILSIRNNSELPVYIHILDLQPDGKVNVLFPGEDDYNQNEFSPGTYVVMDEMQIAINPPSGMEILKVFVSAKPFDMKKLAGLTSNIPDCVLMELGVGNKTAVFNVPFLIRQGIEVSSKSIK
jgi:hypothetical protein